MPTSSDLVTDLPTDFDAFGQPVDNTLKALNPETTLGDIAYRSAVSNTNTRLGIGTAGQVLTVSAGAPSWATPTTGDITEVTAGVGISIASGTGPIPVITNSSTDLITTAGDLLYGSAADTVARLGIGTVGQVLQVNSGATAPEWAAPASVGMTLINSGGTTLSGASTDITLIPSTYNELFIYIINPYSSGSGDTLFYWFNSDTTSANYNTLNYRSINSASAAFQADNAARIAPSAFGTSATNYNVITLRVPYYADTGAYKTMQTSGRFKTPGNDLFLFSGITEWRDTAAISTIKFRQESGGTWGGGTVYVYGVK